MRGEAYLKLEIVNLFYLVHTTVSLTKNTPTKDAENYLLQQAHFNKTEQFTNDLKVICGGGSIMDSRGIKEMEA